MYSADWTHGLDSWTGLADWYKTGNWTSSMAVFITVNHSSYCVIASKRFTCTAAH